MAHEVIWSIPLKPLGLSKTTILYTQGEGKTEKRALFEPVRLCQSHTQCTAQMPGI